MIFIDFQWFFKESGASVGRPLAAFGPLEVVLNDQTIVFRLGLPPKTGPVSRPDRAPSAAIGPHRRPSAACGWELRSRTGLPPQTPPDFLF